MASNAAIRWIPGLVGGRFSSDGAEGCLPGAGQLGTGQLGGGQASSGQASRGQASSGQPAIELAIRDASGSASPFVELADGGRFRQVVLARIALPDGTMLIPMALQIPRAVVRAKGSGFHGAPVDNREIDAMWRRDRSALRDAAGPEVVPSYELLSDKGILPAMSFCRRRELLFAIPSPQSWEALELCCDDAILREHGLEPYSTSTVRYLYSPAQLEAGGGERPTFYTWSQDAGADARASCRVRRRAELYRDLARIGTAALSASQRERLAAEVPCLSCEHAASCCGDGAGADETELPIEAELTPLTVTPSPVLFTRALPQSFASLCDLLGGADAEAAAWDLGAESASKSVGQRSQGGLFDFGRGAEFAAEALCLKLIAFEQVCAAVASFQKAAQRPLFGVSPTAFRVESSAPGLGLPSKWGFRVCLDRTASQHSFALPGSVSTVPELFVPTADVAAAGLSPFADPALFAQELSMGLTVQAVDSAALSHAGESAPTVVVLTLDAKAQGGRIQTARPGDVAVIELHSELPGVGEGPLQATVLRAQPGGAQLRVELVPGVEFPGDCVPLTCGGVVTFYRRLQAPCDLHGLGMMLARALLVHDEADVFAVEDELAAVLEKLRLAVAGVEEPDRSYVTTTLGHLFETGIGGFDFDRVLYRALDREACRGTSAEPAVVKVWGDALVLMMRLIGRISEFSYCLEHDDYDLQRPDALLARVREDVHALVRRLRVELFGQRTRGREIGRLCDGLLVEINAELYGKEGT